MASIRKRTWRDGKTAYVVDWIDKTGRRHNRQFRLYREADKFRRDTERQLDANTFRPDADKMTLRNVCLEFLEHCAGRRQRGERMTRHCLAGYGGHVHNPYRRQRLRHRRDNAGPTDGKHDWRFPKQYAPGRSFGTDSTQGAQHPDAAWKFRFRIISMIAPPITGSRC